MFQSFFVRKAFHVRHAIDAGTVDCEESAMFYLQRVCDFWEDMIRRIEAHVNELVTHVHVGANLFNIAQQYSVAHQAISHASGRLCKYKTALFELQLVSIERTVQLVVPLVDRVSRAIAFGMGRHPRLGRDSLVRCLDGGLLGMIMKYA